VKNIRGEGRRNWISLPDRSAWVVPVVAQHQLTGRCREGLCNATVVRVNDFIRRNVSGIGNRL
jgi:hypothetical protein